MNLTTVNLTFATGLTGSIVYYCNSVNDCGSSVYFKCLIDYDGESITGSSGWCAQAGITTCAHYTGSYHTYENISSGSNFCINSTAYRTCSSSAWSVNATVCGENEICANNTCMTNSSSSSSSSSSGGSSTSSANRSFIRITSSPSSFGIIQGENTSKLVTLTNGNTTQRNVTVTLSGLNADWYFILPPKIENVSARAVVYFNINFRIPHDASIGAYFVVINVTSGNSSVKNSSNFTMTISPSNTTVETEIKPSFASYSTQITELEEEFNAKKSTFNTNATIRIQNLIKFAKTKVTEAQGLIDLGSYLELESIRIELDDIISEIKAALAEKEMPKQEDSSFLITLSVIVAIAAACTAFLLWPNKEHGFSKENGYLPSEAKKQPFSNLRKKLFERKKESFFNGKKS